MNELPFLQIHSERVCTPGKIKKGLVNAHKKVLYCT